MVTVNMTEEAVPFPLVVLDELFRLLLVPLAPFVVGTSCKPENTTF